MFAGRRAESGMGKGDMDEWRNEMASRQAGEPLQCAAVGSGKYGKRRNRKRYECNGPRTISIASDGRVWEELLMERTKY